MKSTTLAGDALVGVATIPLIVGMLAIKAGTKVLQQVGQASEDIFQGDRLPILRTTTVSDDIGRSDELQQADSSDRS
ncbi:MAG: hypothetical protein AAGD25_24535 [Cyanobacteria bacterium P01_F01_bin.150]